MKDITQELRINGALYGLYTGDALAMPVHWYYDHDALKNDYGHVTDYLVLNYPHDKFSLHSQGFPLT